MNIFEIISDYTCIYLETICCLNCFEPEEIVYDGDYITNYIFELSREIENNNKYI